MKKKILYSFIFLFILLALALNYVAYKHSYNFTHYADIQQSKLRVSDTSKIGWRKKINYIMNGVEVPRPENIDTPFFNFATEQIITSNGTIEIWSTNKTNAYGTIILFHGYASKKSSLISRAEQFVRLNFNVVMVDFLGSGGSDGNTVNIGFREADQVKACFDFVKQKGEQHIYLFGISMGSVAIMKCMKDYQPDVKGIILECPFAYMKTTVKNRFKNFGIPSFPMAELLMLWGSYHAGFNTFEHNPAEYAKEINCPTLLMYGMNDHAVSKKEMDAIYNNLMGKKTLSTFQSTGHDIYSANNRGIWLTAVQDFLHQSGSGIPSPFYMDKHEVNY